MTDPHAHSRVDDLEARMAFLERSIEDLDQVVRQLADQLAALHAELGGIRTEVSKHVERSTDLAEEVPPHW